MRKRVEAAEIKFTDMKFEFEFATAVKLTRIDRNNNQHIVTMPSTCRYSLRINSIVPRLVIAQQSCHHVDFS
jgi:hypothetical protein